MIDFYQQLSSFEFWGNSGRDYFLALLTFVFWMIVFRIFRILNAHYLKKIPQSKNRDFQRYHFWSTFFGQIYPWFYFCLAVFISSQLLDFPAGQMRIIRATFLIISALQVILLLQKMIDYLIENFFLAKKEKSESDDMTHYKEEQDKKTILKLSGQIAKMALWILGGLFVFSNLGFNVNSLLAGLGVGGVAIALAMQNILADLFASFSIYFDKPFAIGDLIAIGNDKGTVERIGIKTTRIRTSKGDELIISNRELCSARINNFKKTQKRATSFSLNISYETTPEKLRAIPQIIRQEIINIPEVEFENAHLTTFGDFALIFEINFNINITDYNKYLAIKEEVFYKIFERFKKENIKLAYPTKKIFLEKNS